MTTAAAKQRALPKMDTPERRGQRYLVARKGRNADTAMEMLFAEDCKAMKRARPEWDAERIAQQLRDRGLGQRYGYRWTVRVAKEAIGED